MSRFGPTSMGVPVGGEGGRPEGEALVVLGGQHDVPGAGAPEQFRPGGGVEELGGQLGAKVGVGEAGRVVPAHELHDALLLLYQPPVPEPFVCLEIENSYR
ncbi:hypothetical protein TYRP_009382 [Tyrophagus putrescentiae]|nr:hypothetical protein TYRP_009382 [Tyrophagus putrescentiae]